MLIRLFHVQLEREKNSLFQISKQQAGSEIWPVKHIKFLCVTEQYNFYKVSSRYSRSLRIFAADRAAPSSFEKERDSHCLHLLPTPLNSKDMLAKCSWLCVCFCISRYLDFSVCVCVSGSWRIHFSGFAPSIQELGSALMLRGRGPVPAGSDRSNSPIRRTLSGQPASVQTHRVHRHN